MKNAVQTESPSMALIKIKSKHLRCGGSLMKYNFQITGRKRTYLLVLKLNSTTMQGHSQIFLRRVF